MYKKTRLEDTFSVNMLAVSEGRPETLNLKQIIEHHVDFQVEVCTRKHQTLLSRELEKKEIQEGLIKACDVIDLIIEILRGSKNQTQAKACLTDGATQGIRFKSKASMKKASQLRFTQRQATAILEMRLYRLIGLELEALLKEHEATLANIARYEEILNCYDAMMDVIVKDLNAIKRTFSRDRRTVIENVEMIDKASYERNRETVQEEYKYVFPCTNADKICVFTHAGKMHMVRADKLPLAKVRGKGVPIDNVSNYESQKERILLVASLSCVTASSLLLVTAQGLIKQVEGQEFDVAKRTVAATKLNEGDSLIFAGISSHAECIVLESADGYFLRMPTGEAPFQKRNSLGVRGMRLQEGDLLERAYLLESASDYSIRHKDKNLSLGSLKLAKRDTKGVRA